MNDRPTLRLDADGDVWLVTPTDGGAGDDDVTLLGHVEDNPTVPRELERDLRLLREDWYDGIDFARGCYAASVAAYNAGISGGRWT